MAELVIRAAQECDVGLLHTLIQALAEYEHEPHAVTGTPQMLARWLFDERPVAEALIGEVSGQPAGFALFHLTFSTWECTPGLWLEDLFVVPAHRRHGLGGKLLSRLAAITLERGYTRLGWAALDWNESALDFYHKRDAALLDEWKLHRLSGPSLSAVAASDHNQS